MPHPLWSLQLARAGIFPPHDALAKLDGFLDLLIEWNQKLNLTRITDRADAEVKHIADALTLLPFLPPLPGQQATLGRVTLADVGTGGGVPGLPLAICRPDMDVTLIDGTKKKLDAVAHIANALGVTNVRVLHARAESVNATYDVVTARAVAELGTLLGWCRGIVAPGGRILALKGPRAVAEIEALDARTRSNWAITVHDVGDGLSLERLVLEMTRTTRLAGPPRGP
jgi:16S rRNA (guanine527-N7)-methyltransferase